MSVGGVFGVIESGGKSDASDTQIVHNEWSMIGE